MNYPNIHFMLRHRKPLPVAGLVGCILVGVILSWRTSYPDYAVGGLLLGLTVLVALKLLIEVLALLEEMLMPK